MDLEIIISIILICNTTRIGHMVTEITINNRFLIIEIIRLKLKIRG